MNYYTMVSSYVKICFSSFLIMAGGAASKNSTLRVGDQIISVNDCDVRSMSRIEAWNLMKKLPDGAVSLIIRQQITSS
jgi:C-terminal processing protease CtpA/Prc